MCTALSLQSSQKENFFGRTMDFSYDIEPGLYIIPRNYQWNNVVLLKRYHNCYSFIGIGQETGGMSGFFDGVNEEGFAAAALYFPGYADYDIHVNVANKEPVASFDFLYYILGRCDSVATLKNICKYLYIVGLPDTVTQTAAPLHWIAADRSGASVVVEQTENGLEVLDNPIGVMANSPNFAWHMTNLRNYMTASNTQEEEALWGDVRLTPFGQGGGTSALPGGYTSPERFVRTAFMKTHVHEPDHKVEAILTCFHIMEAVSIPKGIVYTDRGVPDYTKYTAFMNTSTCEYYFRTYENSQIAVAGLRDYDMNYATPIFLGNLSRPVTVEYFRS